MFVAVHRDVCEPDLLPRRRAAGSRDAGDPETDPRAESRTRAAREGTGDDRGDRAVSVDEVGRHVGEDGLRLVRVHDRAALEVIARTAVGGEDRCEQPAGARLGGRDGQLAASQARVDRAHALLELRQGRRSFVWHAARV